MQCILPANFNVINASPNGTILGLALIIEKACFRITIRYRLLVLLMLGRNHYAPCSVIILSMALKRRNGQSKIRISMLRLKLLLTLIKEKSLIHLDPITIWVPRTFYPFVNVGLNRLIDYALSMIYSKHIIEERTLLSNVIVKTGQVVTPWR
jgi:hypothetical protein